MNIQDCKKIAELMSTDFRILHGAPTLSFPESPKTKGKINSNKNIILMVADFRDDGKDIDVAKKTFAFSLAQKLGIKCNHGDF